MSFNGLAAVIALLLCMQQTLPAPKTLPPPPAGTKQTPPPPPAGTQQTPAQPPAGTQKPAAPTTPTEKPAPVDLQKPEPVPEAPKGVTVEPNPALPGQTVTFYWPTDIRRVTVMGGKFVHRREIRGQDLITDSPRKTTTYTFDLWSTGESQGEGNTAPKAAQHQQIKLTVDVYSGQFPHLATYRNPRHWRIDCVAGWNRDVIPQPDPANNALIYFQPAEDSPERIAVAILPVKAEQCTDLMQKVLMDAPTQYDVFLNVHEKGTTQCGVPAFWATFTGVDHALPDIPTKSMVLTFVRDGKGYVISGRARATRYDQMEKLLRSLVRSFSTETEQQTQASR